MAETKNLPGGFNALGGFFYFGAAVVFFAGTTLVWPGTVLDRIWALNAVAFQQLAPLGVAGGAACCPAEGDTSKKAIPIAKMSKC
jgi:hypothetical protein